MPCSSSSTATWVRKKVQLETADNRPPCRGPMCRGSGPGWCFSGSRRESPASLASPEVYFTVRIEILEPHRFAGHSVSSRLYCNPEVLWKLNWFLRDFGYDTDLLGRDEVDKKGVDRASGRGQGKHRKAFRKQRSHQRRVCRRKHQICQCRRRISSSFHPVPGKWRFIVVLKPSLKPLLVCRL